MRREDLGVSPVFRPKKEGLRETFGVRERGKHCSSLESKYAIRERERASQPPQKTRRQYQQMSPSQKQSLNRDVSDQGLEESEKKPDFLSYPWFHS